MTDIYIADQERITHARLSIDAKVPLQIKFIQFANLNYSAFNALDISQEISYLHSEFAPKAARSFVGWNDANTLLPKHGSVPYGTSAPTAADAVEGLIKNPRKKMLYSTLATT